MHLKQTSLASAFLILQTRTVFLCTSQTLEREKLKNCIKFRPPSTSSEGEESLAVNILIFIISGEHILSVLSTCTHRGCLLHRSYKFVLLTIVCTSVGCCKVCRPNDKVSPPWLHMAPLWLHMAPPITRTIYEYK